jgi:hypothetical protein
MQPIIMQMYGRNQVTWDNPPSTSNDVPSFSIPEPELILTAISGRTPLQYVIPFDEIGKAFHQAKLRCLPLAE